MGGIKEFTDYDFRRKKSALVNHPSNLLQPSVVQSLVHRKLGLPEVELPTDQAEPSTVPPTNESISNTLVHIQADEAQATEDTGTSG